MRNRTEVLRSNKHHTKVSPTPPKEIGNDPKQISTSPATTSRLRQHHHATTGYHRFLLSNFKHFLTLFSKFFSSFVHTTCSLSVSRVYLALDEIYHPFRVAIPNNSTLWILVVRGDLRIKDGVLTLYDALFQKDLYPGHTQTKHL